MAKIPTNKNSASGTLKKNQLQGSNLTHQSAAQNGKSGNQNNNNSKTGNANTNNARPGNLNAENTKQGAEKTGSDELKSANAGEGQGKKQNTLESLFEANLKDIYSAEKQLIEFLPETADAASNEDLKNAFNDHLQQTRRHAERIEKIFQRLHIEKGEEEKCEAMEGLIKEGKKIIEEFEEGHVRDSALIIGAQKIEHYEIAAYGSLCELADVLGFTKIEDILDRTLEEEEITDRNLTDIAKDVNDDAYDESQEEETED